MMYGQGNAKAKMETYEFSKVGYPVYVNGEKKDIDAYNYNGYTYVRINDLKKNLNNLSIVWDNNSKAVYVAERTGLGILNYKGKKYVDLACMAERYSGGIIPYTYSCKFNDISNAVNSNNYLEVGIKVNRDIDPDSSVVHYPKLCYCEYNNIKNNIVTLLKMSYENEKYIKETSDYNH